VAERLSFAEGLCPVWLVAVFIVPFQVVSHGLLARLCVDRYCDG
jgi:hypothetical protein